MRASSLEILNIYLISSITLFLTHCRTYMISVSLVMIGHSLLILTVNSTLTLFWRRGGVIIFDLYLCLHKNYMEVDQRLAINHYLKPRKIMTMLLNKISYTIFSLLFTVVIAFFIKNLE